jgi:hypothetical protein
MMAASPQRKLRRLRRHIQGTDHRQIAVDGMHVAARHRDAAGIERRTPFTGRCEADANRRAAEPGDEGTSKQPLQIECDIELFGTERWNLGEPVKESPLDRPDAVQAFDAREERRPLLLDQPCDVGVRVPSTQRGERRQRMDDVAQGTRLDEEDPGDAGHGARSAVHAFIIIRWCASSTIHVTAALRSSAT